ncbi:hypothetical protein E6H29_02415 [Candidatus Bathyarchaeota archaeon]|nr:MAG: hypothetical protein E6H29_02415 [Candidatus Bathyarchaeota archaeon]
MRTVSEPKELAIVWRQQYENLAREFARLLGKGGTVVEIGCGRGQLTIPLAKLVKSRLLTVDSFARPYSPAYRSPRHTLSREKLKGRISLFKEDYRDFLVASLE